MNRPDQDTYFLQMTKLAGSRSNCYRRQVGCVLVDRDHNVLSTGYNGVPRGFPHCKKGQCPREAVASGGKLELCLAIHAEMNALMQCPNIMSIKKAYITVSPCLTCTVMLMNTSCEQIIFEKEYKGNNDAKIAWKKTGRIWKAHNCPKPAVFNEF